MNINLFGVSVDSDTYQKIITKINQNCRNNIVSEINLLQLFMLSYIHGENLIFVGNNCYYINLKETKHFQEVDSTQVYNLLNRITNNKEYSRSINKEIAHKLFVKKYRLSSLEGYKENPSYTVENINKQEELDSNIDTILANANTSEITSDGSVIVTQKDGIKVRLKSNIKDLGKKKNSKQEKDFSIPDINLVDINEVGVREIEKKENISALYDATKGQQKENIYQVDIYYDDHTEKRYISLTDIIMNDIFTQDEISKETLITQEGHIKIEEIKKLLAKYIKSFWTECQGKIVFENPKNIAFQKNGISTIYYYSMIEFKGCIEEKTKSKINIEVLKRFKHKDISERKILKEIL